MPLQIKDTALYTVKEISHMLSVTSVTVTNYLKRGKLKGQKISYRWLVSHEDLTNFIKTCEINLMPPDTPPKNSP
jgi:predicted transcriptional regulator